VQCLAESTLLLADTGSRSVDPSPQEIEIGAIQFQGWQIHPVTAVPLPSKFAAHDAYVVKVNADLRLSPTVAAPRWVEFGFEFDNGVFVADMVPRAVNRPAPASRYAVTRSLAFTPDIDLGAGTVQAESIIVNNLALPALEPNIQALGIGSPAVRWRHRSVTSAGVPVGSHTGWLILLVPAGLREVKALAVAAYAPSPYEETGFAPQGKPSIFIVQLPVGTRSAVSVASGSVGIRLGFAVDIVDYSDRSAPRQREAQLRLNRLMRDTMIAAGVPLGQADIQPTGDGMNVVLPADAGYVVTFPRIMTEFADRLRTDNEGHSDRVRVRMAADIGPVDSAALGFSGPTVIRFCRLVDSDQLRDTTKRNPGADLVVAVSDWLYENLIRPGYSDLHKHAFTRELVVAKRYQAVAWLWASPARDSADAATHSPTNMEIAEQLAATPPDTRVLAPVSNRIPTDDVFGSTVPRWVNVWLAEPDGRWQIGQLTVVLLSIGPRWTAAVMPQLLAEPQPADDNGQWLYVVVVADDAAVRPLGAPLWLPAEGQTAFLRFEVTPWRPGPLVLRFRVFLKQGSLLLQELTTTVTVGPRTVTASRGQQ
jgi:hypothetical protein